MRHSNAIDVAITDVINRSRGALGTLTCHGTAVTELETAPRPTAVAALTRNEYVVPLTKPVTVADSVVDVPSSKVSQESPASDEYSTM